MGTIPISPENPIQIQILYFISNGITADRTDLFWEGWRWLWAFKYKSVCISLLYMWCPPKQSPLFWWTKTSRNGDSPPWSISIANLILECKLFKYTRDQLSSSLPCGQVTRVSSTYCRKHEDFHRAQARATFSKCSIKRLATIGFNGDTVATPSCCS